VVDVDRLLLEIAEELRTTEVKGSHFATIWVGTGLQHAAELVERKRIELICAGIVSDVSEDQEDICAAANR
jgi:hypothetical protein